MDPSEFEDTIIKQSDALNAGALELFLHPNFENLDLSKDISDICVSIFTLNDQLSNFEDFSMSGLCSIMDDQALKLSELKETYINRRKQLTAKVKKFSSEYFVIDSDASINVQVVIPEMKDLVESFKAEFDNLASLSRHAESSFLSIHKTLREVPDPVPALNNSLQVCQRAHEAMKRAQDQLNVANSVLTNNNNQSHSGQKAPHQQTADIEAALRVQMEREVADLKQNFLNDISNLKATHDVELRNKVHSLQATYEQQQLELEQTCALSAAKKDAELASLLRSLSEHKQHSLEALERGRLLDEEVTRRRELENRLRATLANLAECESVNSELKERCGAVQEDLHQLTVRYTEDSRSWEESRGSAQLESLDLKSRLDAATISLAQRPPIDFQHLVEKVGSVAVLSSNDAEQLSWSEVEERIINAVRTANADATSSRVREHESSRQLSVMLEKNRELAAKLERQTALASSLERDLLSAHSALQAGKKGSSPKKVKSSTGESDRDGSLDQLLGESHSDDIVTAEDGTGSSGGGGIGLKSGSDRILLAVQSQRDRFMKACREKDAELDSLKVRFDRQQNEQLQLRNENLQLYRRLRVLRVASSGGQPKSHSSAGYLRRKGVLPGSSDVGVDGECGEDDEESGAALDDKYMDLYEAEISPFKVEELDKQSVLARLNVFERALVYVNRNVIQDRWSRHAFIVYLLLVHLFALLYAFSVLNPQMAEELDMHMKARWSAEAMDRPDPDMQRM